MMYGLESLELAEIQEAKVEVTQLKMLSFSLGVNRMERIRIRNKHQLMLNSLETRLGKEC